MTRRWAILLSLLAATVFAIWLPVEGAKPDDELVTPALRSAHSRTRVLPKTASSEPAGSAHLRLWPASKSDPFLATSWAPPPKRLPPPPPPPPKPVPVVQAPEEPSFPFRFVGRLRDETGATQVYLARGEGAIVAHEGERFDPQYQLTGGISCLSELLRVSTRNKLLNLYS
ncbi:hypothetical protein [Niveibacterium terrae]|uniref:hypothetical protein n=1 Tax=Niveibacterium terrae TaxID=3373598 RepID=UPI003A8CDA37